MSLELHDDIMGELNYAVRLWVPGHLHGVYGGFDHCSNGSVEDRICCIVNVLVEVTQVEMRVFGCLDSALGPSFVPPPASCSPSLILIRWSICSQVKSSSEI